MKKILLATVAVVALATAAPVFGADLGARPYYSKAPAPVYAPIYSWTGFYVGGHIGGAFNGSNSFDGFALSDHNTRLLGGIQVGADYQFHPNFVVGVEGQYSWLDGNQVTAAFATGHIYNNEQRGIASITGRVGWTWGPGMVYAKGGYAYSDNNETLTFLGTPIGFALDHSHRDGFTVGGGIEYMFAPNWSAKAEYQYYDFGDSRFIAPIALVPVGSFHNDEHTVKAGINYRFNLGGAMGAPY